MMVADHVRARVVRVRTTERLVTMQEFDLSDSPETPDRTERTDPGISRRSVMAAGMLPLALAPGLRAAATAGYAVRYLTFDDVAPSYLTLTQSWNAMGMDDADRVYITWTCTRTDAARKGLEDTALFRYDPATGKREFIASYLDTADRQGNLLAGEQMPKGHTRIVQIGRKLYMASMGFHDFKGAIDTLPQYRGSHLFTYDLDTGAFVDATATLTGGVLIKNQGIVALSYSPEHDVLIGLAHPLGDLVLINPRDCTVRKVVPGIPWQLNHMVSREVVITKTGKVYTYRGPEERQYRTQQNEVWVYDLATDSGALTRTGQYLKAGYWNGQAATTDRSTIYLSTVNGNLYALDVKTGKFTLLTYFIDAAETKQKYIVAYLCGISLNAKQDTIVGAPVLAASSSSRSLPDVTRLMTYSLTGKTVTKQANLTIAMHTGSNHRDKAGHLYMTAFDWETNCKLAVITPPA
jgi:outer membrane protein assembly factor BamB